jgi:predicted ABC-class ATPase
MADAATLRELLVEIDGQGYKTYKRIRGSYWFGDYSLSIDHVQGDPFAAPSRFRVRIDLGRIGFPEILWANRSRTTGFCTFLASRFAEQARRVCRRRGSGKSGHIGIDTPGQEILERTCVMLHDGALEVRFFVGLPAAGRRVLSNEAVAMIFEDIPAIVSSSLFGTDGDRIEASRHASTNEDADCLRGQLMQQHLVAFIGNGSILPRRSGVEQSPLAGEAAVPFQSPPSLEVSFDVPNAGNVGGMGIPQGVTLVVGGGFHGKSTLLQALQRGVYNHIPGDGRERVITDGTAVKIRADDGRSITSVDISPFFGGLPDGSNTGDFSTSNASGSTSQAATTVEAIEVGSRLLLIDEDTCASNFMSRDHRMQQLVENEPITPLIDRLRALYEQFGVSTILVAGSNGDFFDVADTVIAMENYTPRDATIDAAAIAARFASPRRPESIDSWKAVRGRSLQLDRLDPRKGHRAIYHTVRGRHTILFGEDTIDLHAVEQVVDSSQTRAIAAALQYCAAHCGPSANMPDLVEEIDAVAHRGLDHLSGAELADLARFRPHELAAAFNRLRSLSCAVGE